MNIVLVSGRYPAPSEQHAVDAAYAEALAAGGIDVRWVHPVPRADATAGIPAGIRSIAVESPAPPFQAVQDRLLDPRTELELSRSIRAEMADLVHLLDYGGSTSTNACWVADRLGTRTVITMRALPVLCHRGDLRYRDAEECTDWQDPARCTRCTRAPTAGGLSLSQSVIGRGLGALRSPINPYPTASDFVNRPELLVGGAQFVDRIVVGSDAERQQLSTLGWRAERFEVIVPWRAGASVEPWVGLYQRVIQ